MARVSGLGDAIRKQRVQRRQTQQEMADEMRVSRSWIAGMESGKAQTRPRELFVARAGDHLGLGRREAFTRAGYTLGDILDLFGPTPEIGVEDPSAGHVPEHRAQTADAGAAYWAGDAATKAIGQMHKDITKRLDSLAEMIRERNASESASSREVSAIATDDDGRLSFRRERRAAALRLVRDARGLAIGQVAVRMGANSRTVTRWETGESEPSLRQFRDLAILLDVPLSLLTDPPPTDEEVVELIEPGRPARRRRATG